MSFVANLSVNSPPQHPAGNGDEFPAKEHCPFVISSFLVPLCVIVVDVGKHVVICYAVQCEIEHLSHNKSQ